MRVWFAILSLLLLALAGCTDSGDEDGTGTSSSSSSGSSSSGSSTGSSSASSSSGSSSSSSNSSGPDLNGTAPTAALTVTVAEGFTPVLVTFKFSATGFQDPEFVDWTLDIDDDGVPEAEGFGGLPSTYEQTITKEGNFSARFVADDGVDLAEATFDYATIAEPEVPPQAPIQITGTAMIGLGGEDPITPIDHAYTATQVAKTMTVSMTFDVLIPVVDDLDWALYRPDGSLHESGANIGQEDPIVVADAVAGDWTVQVRPFTGANIAYTIDIVFS